MDKDILEQYLEIKGEIRDLKERIDLDQPRLERINVVVPPQFVGRDQLAELRTPVAQVVDAHHVISQVFVDLVKRAADRR